MKNSSGLWRDGGQLAGSWLVGGLLPETYQSKGALIGFGPFWLGRNLKFTCGL
jgi:hypothetical protein